MTDHTWPPVAAPVTAYDQRSAYPAPLLTREAEVLQARVDELTRAYKTSAETANRLFMERDQARRALDDTQAALGRVKMERDAAIVYSDHVEHERDRYQRALTRIAADGEASWRVRGDASDALATPTEPKHAHSLDVLWRSNKSGAIWEQCVCNAWRSPGAAWDENTTLYFDGLTRFAPSPLEKED